MSLAYIDPGNLESNVQQGAYTRFDLVWVLWWATFTGLVLQEMSARLGLVTGRDLAQTVKAEYPVWISRIVYISMELAVVGSDVQEVVGWIKRHQQREARAAESSDRDDAPPHKRARTASDDCEDASAGAVRDDGVGDDADRAV